MTGTYIVRLGHSIVYRYVDIGAHARYRSCLYHTYTYSTFGGNMGYEYSAAERMASYVEVCRWERTVIISCIHEGLPDIYMLINQPDRWLM